MWFRRPRDNAWWDDLWLNESFAEWASHFANTHATRFHDAWATFANQRKGWAYRQDQLPTTHPIAADMVDLEAVYVNFDGITYAKGASRCGNSSRSWARGLPQGTALYFAQVRLVNTSLNDLLTALADADGRDLTHLDPTVVADLWGQHAGPRSRPARTVPWARWQFSRSRPCRRRGTDVARPHASPIGLYRCAKAPSSGLIRWRSM